MGCRYALSIIIHHQNFVEASQMGTAFDRQSGEHYGANDHDDAYVARLEN